MGYNYYRDAERGADGVVPLLQLRKGPSQGQCLRRGFVRVDWTGDEVAAEGEDEAEGEGCFLDYE